MPRAIQNDVPRRAYTLEEFHKAGGPCRARSYQLINAGRLRAVKSDRRTLIPATEFERYFAALPAYEPRP